jgi:cysteine desulfurase/selenocysteine lyase
LDLPITDYRKLFPITQHYAYMNHAACAAMPQPGLDALARYWEGQSTRGVLNEMDYFPVIDHAREKMARLLGVEECEVGWVQNTATAISLVANGLEWQRGDNVVTVQGEFPANVYPWLGLSRWGVETRFVQQRGGCVSVDDVAAMMDESTRLLSISFVDFGTGVRNDLAALGQLCEERGVLFNVDAIQGLGALRLDPHGCGIHFLGAGAHKWLMGPQGVGVFYVRKDVLERLHPLTANWYSVVDKHDHLNYGQPWVESAARVEGSTPNVSGLVAFDAVLKMILDARPAYIEERVLSLSGRLMEGLLARGYDVVSSSEPAKRSGVICFRATGDPLDLLARAQAEKIVIAVRVGVVRVSPHFYNSEDEIDSLLALL